MDGIWFPYSPQMGMSWCQKKAVESSPKTKINTIGNYINSMKTHTDKKTNLTIVLPMSNGDVLEIDCNKETAKEFVAPAPLIEKLTKKCIPVATSSDYNLLVLDF